MGTCLDPSALKSGVRERPSALEARIVQINRGTVFINSTADQQAANIESMEPNVLPQPGPSSTGALNKLRVPVWLKWAYTAFMMVLVPVYLANYGPTNFIYFCDAALFLTLFAVWTDNALLASMAAVGILVPQFFWCVDFGGELLDFHMTGMTSYMFGTCWRMRRLIAALALGKSGN